MTALNINCPTYSINASAVSASVTLIPLDAQTLDVVIYNTLSETIFVRSSLGASAATVTDFPITAGATYTFAKSITHDTISVITSGSSGKVYVTAGNGDALVGISGSGATTNALPGQSAAFLNVQAAPPKTNRMGFAAVSAVGFDPLEMTTIVTGTGMAVSQTGGSAIITTGTTANAETIGRSLSAIDGDMRVRFFHTLSQRIVNNSFYIEMVDILGDALAVTVNSTTSVTVVIPGTTITATNVGQSVYIGNITGIAVAIPGRYAIASVSGTSITFTVAGWPASGSGTASLFGMNYHHVLYDGTVATTAKYGCQRSGYATTDISVTTSTTVSGELGLIQAVDAKASFYDSAGTAGTSLTQQTSTPRNVPVDGTSLFLQVRALNGSSAPATTTTWTIGFCETENFIAQSTSIDNVSAQSQETGVPVIVSSIGSITPGTGATSLGKAEDAVSASGDTGIFVLAVRRDTLTTSASATGDYNEIAVSQYGAANVIQYEKMAKTYSCSANITVAAAATDIAILPGNATNTVYVTKVTISGIQTTGGVSDVQLIKRSTANTVGTSAAMTPIPHDANDAAAVSAPLSYTANPTPGSAVGTVRRAYLPFSGATATTNDIVEFNFGALGRPIILRGIAQGLAINLGGATLTGGILDVCYEWFEQV